MPGIQQAQASAQAEGRLYLSISYTDPIEGSLEFLLGMIGFESIDGTVSEVVSDWGNPRDYLGSAAASEITVSFALNAAAVPTGSSTRYTIASLFQRTAIRSKPVSIHQWNADSGTKETIWKGFLVRVIDYDFSSGLPIAKVLLRSETLASFVQLAPTLNPTDFPNAPTPSFGQIEPVAYGDFRAYLPKSGSGTQQLRALALGYPLPAVPALAVDEKIASGTSRFTRHVFARADGISIQKSILTAGLATAVPNQTVGDLFVYLPDLNCYGILDPSYVSAFANNTTECFGDVNNAPRVYAVIRPTEIGATHSASVTDAYKIIDNDPTNYVTLTATGVNIAFALPNLGLGAGRVEKVYLAFDIDDTGAGFLNIGLYNTKEAGGATYWNSKAITQGTFNQGRRQYITKAPNGGGETVFLEYVPADAANSLGGSSASQFQQGRFVGLDNAGNEVPIQILCTLNTASPGGLKVYAMAIVVQLIYPRASQLAYQMVSIPVGFQGPGGNYYDIQGRKIPKRYSYQEQKVTKLEDPKSSPGLQVLSAGRYQEDDASGTITGVAGGLIQKAPDVVRHLLEVRGGFAVNSTSGTLGNLADMQTEEVAGEKSIAPSFYGEPLDCLSAAKQVESRWPIRILKDQEIYNAFGDDMNPHSSRLYRSSSDLVLISAKRDIVDRYIRVQEDDPTGFVNRVILNYGQGYGRGDAMGSYEYNNPMSQDAFGVTDPPSIANEPWIIPTDITSGTPENAKFLARWLGRRNARPRLGLIVRLTQAWYDLRRGHIVGFDKDIEDEGILIPAFRSGLFDYAYESSTSTTNQALDASPNLMPAGGVSSYSIFVASQQFDEWTVVIGTPGAHTAVTNAWQYSTGAAGWSNYASVTCSDGGSPDTVFTRSGKITMKGTRPTPTSWKKDEFTIGSLPRGPGYGLRYQYTNATTAALGSAPSGYPAKLYGRSFEVIDKFRDESRGIPFLDVQLREVM